MSSSAIQSISHNKYYNWLIRNLFSSWANTILTIIAHFYLSGWKFLFELGFLQLILDTIFKEN